MLSRLTIAVAGAAVLALSLGACSAQGGAPAAEDGSPGTSAETAKGAIAWSYPSQDVVLWAEQLKLMRPIIEGAGYEFLTHDPGFDVQAQMNDWQTWITRGDVKAMGGFPLDPAPAVPITAEANAAGIPVIGYLIEWEGVKAATLASAFDSAYDLGVLAADWAAANGVGAGDTVALLADYGSPYGQAQSEGFTAGIKDSKVDFVIAELSAQTREEGYQKAQSQLIAAPNTVIWLSMGADIALGARQALLDSGVSATDPGYFIGATDVTNEVLDLIATDKDIFRTAVISPLKALAESNAQLLLDAAAGKPVTSNEIAPVQITSKNQADHRMN